MLTTHTHPHTPLLVRGVNRGYKICTMKSWIYPQFAGENLSVYPHLHRKSSTCVYKTMTYYYANGELNSFFKNQKKPLGGGYTSPFAQFKALQRIGDIPIWRCIPSWIVTQPLCIPNIHVLQTHPHTLSFFSSIDQSTCSSKSYLSFVTALRKSSSPVLDCLLQCTQCMLDCLLQCRAGSTGIQD